MNAVRIALENLDRYGSYNKVHFEGASYTNTHMVAFARSLATEPSRDYSPAVG
jgi:hypothetical protein